MAKASVSGVALAILIGLGFLVWDSARRSIEAFHNTPYGMWE